ncbi:hypothetical protein EDB83DRAFT_2314338 [Lactarius deliciosus]|nr:hypothetical protein EDB83DRAFT_2314338 [Lactarius deliciosus]
MPRVILRATPSSYSSGTSSSATAEESTCSNNATSNEIIHNLNVVKGFSHQQLQHNWRISKGCCFYTATFCCYFLFNFGEPGNAEISVRCNRDPGMVWMHWVYLENKNSIGNRSTVIPEDRRGPIDTDVDESLLRNKNPVNEQMSVWPPAVNAEYTESAVGPNTSGGVRVSVVMNHWQSPSSAGMGMLIFEDIVPKERLGIIIQETHHYAQIESTRPGLARGCGCLVECIPPLILILVGTARLGSYLSIRQHGSVA